MVEYFLRRLGGDRFAVVSAGTHPEKEVHPLALELLHQYQIDGSDAVCQSWKEYEKEPFDFVISVASKAETSEVAFPGSSVRAFWRTEDPAQSAENRIEAKRQFKKIAIDMYRRAELLCSLPWEKMDRLRREEAARSIN